MNTGIFITARLGSTRLKRKHLLPVNNQPIIYFLIKRIITEFSKEIDSGSVNIIITTSDEEENREFERFNDMGISVFYGSKNNIPLRHIQASNNYDIDAVISVEGDDILCSTFGMRKVFEELQNGEEYIQTLDLPFGMNSCGYSYDILRLSVMNRKNEIIETGWLRIFNQDKLKNIKTGFEISNNKLRFTLDYQEDYLLFKKIIEDIGNRILTASSVDIVKYVMDNKLFTINESISKAYWDNFNRNLELESTNKGYHA